MGKISPELSNGMFDGDIREYKKMLRTQCKAFRTQMDPWEKQKKDESIFNRIVGSKAYAEANVILTYVSTGIEVDTRMLIGRAVSDRKRVAVPRCIDGTRNMDFYFIYSVDDLEKGTFGVLEPDPKKCIKAYSFDDALCIVPGLSFNMSGYRLGYGGGYYDRFLSAHPDMFRMGVCYCGCTVNRLIHGRFDVCSDMLVTEKYAKGFERSENINI